MDKLREKRLSLPEARAESGSHYAQAWCDHKLSNRPNYGRPNLLRERNQ
jgi:hypothetical protein